MNPVKLMTPIVGWIFGSVREANEPDSTPAEQLKAVLRESMRLDPPPKPAAPVPASDAKGPRP